MYDRMTFPATLIPCLVSAILSLFCQGVMAAEEAPQEGVEELPRLPAVLQESSAWSWLESSRDSVSRNVTNIGRQLDDWLAGDGVGERSNERYLRLRLNQQISETGAYYSNVRISGRVDLPRATERWKLIFESEHSELESLRDQRLDNIRPS